jgi:uroporphyrinogen-III synthase
MRSLEGLGVLVTRPQPQSSPLCHRLLLEGARALCFPTLEIEPVGERRALAAQLGSLAAFDLVIFVSANAVRFGSPLLEQRRDVALAAVGAATARALNQAGYRVAVQPEDGSDSESLLRHPRLKSAAGKRFLLVKGEGGRALLEEELKRRGAHLTVIEVYRRVRAQPTALDLAALAAEFEAEAVQAITVTSVEVGEALLALATPALRAALERVAWVVPGTRVAAALRERGVGAPLLLAASAEDQALVEALKRWRAGESGAKSNESK